MGRRDIHFGPVLRTDAGRVNQFATEMFICMECGHLELFHPRIGSDRRSENPPYDINAPIQADEPPLEQ